ncbi:MAG: ribonuclease Z [Actinomycetes bacterium]
MDQIELFFAGTGGSVPTPRRGLPATLARLDGDRLLFDCGEGTQRQLIRSIGLADLDAIFLTHLHADHWLGIPGLVRTLELRGREKALDIYGPGGTVKQLAAVGIATGKTDYELHISELEAGDAIEFDGYEVESFNVRHRGTALGYSLIEAGRPGRFDPERAKELGITDGKEIASLVAGESVGNVEPTQVIGEPRAGRKIVISGDTAPCEMVEAAASGADVLLHEATFADEDSARAAETMHSTARQAAEIAAAAGAAMLALTHISARYPVRKIIEEAEAVFAGTVVPRDFDAINIPVSEKGAPSLLRPDDVEVEQAAAAQFAEAAEEGSAKSEN